MAYLEYMNCCGIVELAAIKHGTPEQNMDQVCQQYFDETPRAFMVFSSIKTRPEGKRLAKYIKDHGLGKTHKMNRKMNPNTHHQLDMWIWAVNNPALKSLAIKKGWYDRQVDTEEDNNW